MKVSIFRSAALAALTSCIAVVSASAIPRSSIPALQTVYQFPNNTWLENMAIRSNGHILAVDIDNAVLYDLDPNSNPVAPVQVAALPTGSIPAGITEVEPDVFYVNNGMGKAITFTFNANSSSIWKVDMNTYAKTGKAATSKLLDIPPATFLNGMVTANVKTGTILTSDSVNGVIYSVNVREPSFKLALDHPILKPNPNLFPSIGVNGLRIRGSSLYFVNTNYGYLGTFPISSSGVITSTPTLITSSVPAADDFDIDRAGNVWLAENTQNTFVKVTPQGNVTVIAGGKNSTEIIGPVSARFGKGRDANTLYISTDGLTFGADHKPATTNGKIARLNIANGGW